MMLPALYNSARAPRDKMTGGYKHDEIGKRLEGLQFSGRRCVLTSNSSITVGREADSDKKTEQRLLCVNLNSTQFCTCKSLCRSAPSLLAKPLNCDKNGYNAVINPTYKGIADHYKSARQISDSLVENTAVCRHQKIIGQMAARRLSERAATYGVSC